MAWLPSESEAVQQLTARIAALEEENNNLKNDPHATLAAEVRSGLGDELRQNVAAVVKASFERASDAGSSSAVYEGQIDSLTKTLQDRCGQFDDLSKKLRDVESLSVLQLEKEKAALRADNDRLQKKVSELEQEDDVKLGQLRGEVSKLEQHNEELASDLKKVKEDAKTVESDLSALVQGIVATNASGLADAETIAELKAEQNRQQTEGERCQVELEESHKATLRDMEVEYAQKQQALEGTLAQVRDEMKSLTTAHDALQREAAAQVASHETIVAELTGKIERFEAIQSEQSTRPEDNDDKRQDIIRFWVEGRGQIDALERQVSQLTTMTDERNAARDELQQLKVSRRELLESLDQLAKEVTRLREDNVNLRATIVGADAEKAFLGEQLAALVESEMSGEEIAACTNNIRRAARDAAVASAAVVYDEAAVEKTMHSIQQMQQELTRLTRRRDQLGTLVRTREERLGSLNAAVAARCAGTAATAPSVVDVVRDVADASELEHKRKRLELLEELKVSREKQSSAAASEVAMQELVTSLETQLTSSRDDNDKAHREFASEVKLISDKSLILAQQNAQLKDKIAAAEKIISRQQESLASAQRVSVTLLHALTEGLDHNIRQHLTLTETRKELRERRQATDTEGVALGSDSAASQFADVVTSLESHLSLVKVYVGWSMRSESERENASVLQMTKSLIAYQELVKGLRTNFETTTQEQIDQMMKLSNTEREVWEKKQEQRSHAFAKLQKDAAARMKASTTFWEDSVAGAIKRSAATSASNSAQLAAKQSGTANIEAITGAIDSLTSAAKAVASRIQEANPPATAQESAKGDETAVAADVEEEVVASQPAEGGDGAPAQFPVSNELVE